MKKIVISISIAIILGCGLIFSLDGQKKSNNKTASGTVVKVATYNVENAFDMVANGSEYVEYIPNFKGWDKDSFEKKFTNTARVIQDIDADVIALQEVENQNALSELQKRLKSNGSVYAYSAITSNEQSAVQVAVLSKHKIIKKDELSLKSQRRERPVLKLTIDINGTQLILYANHWKAKTGPESMRMDYARVLMQDIATLPSGADYIILGDLNSNYNEFETIANEHRLNDTGGVTAINDLLKTVVVKNGAKKSAEKVDVVANSSQTLHYNLWLELQKSDRMSETFGKDRGTPDNIIIPRSMFDKSGINYIDGSFTVFAPSYLLDNKGRPFRWQGKDAKHTAPDGFSDHLPIYASFSLSPFSTKQSEQKPESTTNKPDTKSLKKVDISQIYDKNITGDVDVVLKDCIVLYKSQKGFVVKQRNGRAIFIYEPKFDMKLSHSYDLRITSIDEFKGLKEIKNLFDLKDNGKVDIKDLKLKYSGQNIESDIFQNEVISELTGYYSRGKLVFDSNKEIKVYFADKNIKPAGLTKIFIKNGHLSRYDEPQIVINSKSDFEVLD